MDHSYTPLNDMLQVSVNVISFANSVSFKYCNVLYFCLPTHDYDGQYTFHSLSRSIYIISYNEQCKTRVTDWYSAVCDLSIDARITPMSAKILRITYRFFIVWNCDKLPEEIDQPLSIENDCLTVLDNYSQVVIELHHGVKLFVVFYKALVPCITSKLLQILVIFVFGYQSIDHLFKTDPPNE